MKSWELEVRFSEFFSRKYDFSLFLAKIGSFRTDEKEIFTKFVHNSVLMPLMRI